MYFSFDFCLRLVFSPTDSDILHSRKEVQHKKLLTIPLFRDIYSFIEEVENYNSPGVDCCPASSSHPDICGLPTERGRRGTSLRSSNYLTSLSPIPVMEVRIIIEFLFYC